MNKSLIIRCLGKLFLSLLLAAGSLFFSAAGTDAAESTVAVTLKSAGEDGTTYEMKELDSVLKNVPASAQIAFSIDNPDCIQFSYMHQINKSGSKSEENSTFTLSGSQLKDYSEFTLEALCATPANTPASATVKVMNGSMIASQVTYSVTVTPTTPRFPKRLLGHKNIRTYVDELALGEFDNVSAGASISIWASKPLVYCYDTIKYVEKKQKEVRTTKTKAISTTESAPTIITNLEPNDVEVTNEHMISKTSTGKINLYVVVKQDGKEYKKTYSFTATKYVNPFQNFSVKLKNGKNLQMAKLFNTRNTVSNNSGGGISSSQAKNMQGGRPWKIKMKKGFKITKIRYRKSNEWAGMAKIRKWSESYSTMPSDFWEFYIYYKDKSGKTYNSSIFITGDVFTS